MSLPELPVPPHFQAEAVERVWKVPYLERAAEARRWAEKHEISSSAGDAKRICLLLVDVQNTFCIPDYELYVGGRSGMGAVEDNRRLCDFLYRNLASITQICATMDTHQAIQIFHAIFLVDAEGRHPDPYTLVTAEDVDRGKWCFNPAVAAALGLEDGQGQGHLEHYIQKLAQGGKYALTIWPYHAMLGGIGHALVPAVEEAVFFHAITRCSQPVFRTKGGNPLTEHYSVLRPEVLDDGAGEQVGGIDLQLIDQLLSFDAVIVTGQAKSHCVAWTLQDLLAEIQKRDAELARRFYLLVDCTSPVVVPGVIDYTEEADAAFQRFAAAGMHRVLSTVPIAEWPDIYGHAD